VKLENDTITMVRAERKDKSKGTQYRPDESISFPELECCFPEITVGRNVNLCKIFYYDFYVRIQGETVVKAWELLR